MKNPRYDYTLLHPDQYKLLAEIRDGITHYRPGVGDLIKRKLVDVHIYHLTINTRGIAALAYLTPDLEIIVSEDYPLRDICGVVGTVTEIVAMDNGDLRVEARMGGLAQSRPETTWCFYETANGPRRDLSRELVTGVPTDEPFHFSR